MRSVVDVTVVDVTAAEEMGERYVVFITAITRSRRSRLTRQSEADTRCIEP
jgi:hypothetical protein